MNESSSTEGVEGMIIKKEVKYYYKNREQILAKKKALRHEKNMQDPEYALKYNERMEKREEKELKERLKQEREAARNAKRDAILVAKTGSSVVLPGAANT